MSKKRIVKDYENLPEEIVSRVKMEYPHGFADHLVSFTNKDGVRVSALPFDTEETYYLIRMTMKEARQIVNEDEDYDNEGNLRDDYSMDEFEAPEGDDDDDEEDPKSSFDDY